jgi:DNA-binding SARP family transcriptional activator
VEQWDGGVPTESVEAQRMQLAHAHLELHVVQEGQREFRFPFYKEELDLASEASAAFPDGAPWTAHLAEGRVVLRQRDTGVEHVLAAGESIVVEERRIWLIDVRRPPTGTLEGITPPFSGQVWHLRSSQSWLGRRGKRLNHIELDHPTISRTHVTFLPDATGGASLFSETAATSVNGEPLPPGQTQKLKNGDLLGLGKLMFRFSGPDKAEETKSSLLFVQTLGAFRVSLDSKSALPMEIRNEKARWLLALLAVGWGEPRSVELLLEEFWPGVTGTRGRKNLSHTLTQLKEAFSASGLDADSVILRNTAELRLNPERLGQHDLVEVAKLTRDRKPLTSDAALDHLLENYRGKFLPACYESWADDLRFRLEADVTETLQVSARDFLAAKNYRAALKAGEKALELDPLDDQAPVLMMEAALGMAKPELALSVFESSRKALIAEGLEPSIELIKLSHRARLGI